MFDFFMVSTRPGKRGSVEIYPRFIIKKSSDLMIRGGDFYAIWDEENKRWSTEEDDAKRLIDQELDKYYEEHKDRLDGFVKIMHMWDAETGVIDIWHRYCQKQMRDNFHVLDENLMFSNAEPTKKDYSSKSLNYPLEAGPMPAYEKLMSTLYSPTEREKIEWAIGSVINGDSKKIQKFLVLYGSAGTGKSTVLNIIQQLFNGYYSVFDAKSLGSANSQFALESLSSNPLVAIQHDGDLSHIEDNTRLNSLVSHEMMVVNEKRKNLYSMSFKSFLFMGTNKPVKITDAKSGIIRRLIDVSPSGNKLPVKEYNSIMKQISFELGAIAWHCKEVYESDPGKYNEYIPLTMLGASNNFYNFVMDSFEVFEREDSVTLRAAWEMYKTYCDETNVPYPLSQMLFKEELKNYFLEFHDRQYIDGIRVRNYYKGFKSDKFDSDILSDGDLTEPQTIEFKEQPSIFDSDGANYPAQYASDKGIPLKTWDNVTTKLSDLDTSKLHYVKVPENHIVIDFDIPDADGNKCYEKNLEEASKWPATYAELSKSGAGIHLHYLYNGDASKLSRIYGDHIEIKVFNGNSSLRRKLTKCNNLPVAIISSGLPLQDEKKKVDGVKIKSQKKLFEMIERNLRKEIHGSTKPSVDFIYKIVEDAYNDGISYQIPDEMKKRILDFAAGSTHQSKECVKLMKKMHYQSKDYEMKEELKSNSYKLRKLISSIMNDGSTDIKHKFDLVNECLLESYNSGIIYDVKDIRGSLLYSASSQKLHSDTQYCLDLLDGMKFCSEELIESEKKDDNRAIIFFDIEVYPNLFLICWKLEGEDQPIIRWYNPTPEQIEELLQFRLIGYNCRRYDNHEVYASLMGYDVEKLYKLSQKIINNGTGFFGEAYNLSYTDVYDFASAGNKCSLKKAEIEMGIHHQEMEFAWDQPVPEDKWPLVGDYCCNDVRATEVRFHWLKGDWTARQILADVAEMTVNDTTNSLTTRIIFGRNRKPQDKFNYRDLSKPVKTMDEETMRFLSEACPDMMSYQHGAARSILPYFPGYKFENGKSMYRGEDVGLGGYVYAEPGVYTNVALLDVASMHPHSIISECLFGVEYTTAFRDIVMARVYIKHEQWSKVEKILGGKLKPYVQKVKDGEMTSKELSNALKTAINSVYGLTSASFENPFKDERNIDNIVAKRGALFMVDLKHAVQERGFTVAHIKTDSIKIPDATPEIIQFVMEFGKMYGYTFEHEATYEKMCLVNEAVYIAKYADGDHEFDLSTGETIVTPWTATGTEFQIPYVFKTLFAKYPTNFKDFCETKQVKSAMHLDLNEGMPEDEHCYRFVGRVGQFTPVVNGIGGGILLREQGENYYSVTGTKGYRWLESEVFKSLYVENCERDDWYNLIDMNFYKDLVDTAVNDVSKYCDFEWFSS